MRLIQSMQRMLMLNLALFAAGCSSSKPSASSVAPTEMVGTWNVSVTGTFGTSTVPGTFQVKLISSACSVTTPLGVFSVQGSACFIANNNSGAGAISGVSIPSTSKNLGQGILVGVASDPVPDNSPINMVFVSSQSGGKSFQEFTGTATISAAKMTGSGACSTASTASCTGAAATFTATHQ